MILKTSDVQKIYLIQSADKEVKKQVKNIAGLEDLCQENNPSTTKVIFYSFVSLLEIATIFQCCYSCNVGIF